MYPVSIKGVLFSPGNEVVLLLNDRNEWELPGGRLEPGETPAVCLTREMAEELDLQIKVNGVLDSYLFEVIPGKHVFIVTYSCSLNGPFQPVMSNEHQRIGVFPLQELPANLPDGYRASIAAAIHFHQISP